MRSLRMNMPGVSFNNQNWPYIVRAMRAYTAVVMTVYPVLYLAGVWFVPEFWFHLGEKALAGVAALTLVVILYTVGKKYE